MTKITAAHSMSLDGFIDSARLHDWLHAGDTPSRLNPAFTMSAPSAQFFDEGVGRCGAVIAGRSTYDVSDGVGRQGTDAGSAAVHRDPSRSRRGAAR